MGAAKEAWMASLSTEERWIVTCTCGARVEITIGDGIPGCRDVEVAYCPKCHTELARHHGDCDARLVAEGGGN